ncbi:MAG: hypothetical protein HYW45_02250 [Candidatus Daviesbacteria bacterium]|nr:MAG: hypothetical protein HYW45_02250 [Candidatus Daviesbacteria bacterium]
MAAIQEQGQLIEHPIEVGEKFLVQNLDVPHLAVSSGVAEVASLEIPDCDKLFRWDSFFQRVWLKTCKGDSFSFTTARRLGGPGIFVSRSGQYRFFRTPRDPQDLRRFSIEEVIGMARVPHSSDLIKVRRIIK